MKKRIDLRAVTLIFGVIVALIILLSVWILNPTQSPLSFHHQFAEPLTLKEMGRMVLQSLW